MIALPLWQPWATLVVIGAKKIETRSWAPRAPLAIGERIAIYATVGGIPKGELDRLLISEHFHEALIGRALPRGAIVGTATLRRAARMTAETVKQLHDADHREWSFGHYAPGRWAWRLDDPVACLPAETRPPAGRRGPFKLDPTIARRLT